PQRRPRRFARRRATEITATQGRWSRTERLFADQQPDRRALAELLLERQGIVTRDGVRAEGITGGYGAVYGELKALETLGLCRRGYFVEGLGGAQFALGGAVERVRELRPKEGEEPDALVLAAPRAGRARRAGPLRRSEAARGRALRRRARRRDRADAAAARGGFPRRAAKSGSEALGGLPQAHSGQMRGRGACSAPSTTAVDRRLCHRIRWRGMWRGEPRPGITT